MYAKYKNLISTTQFNDAFRLKRHESLSKRLTFLEKKAMESIYNTYQEYHTAELIRNHT